MAARPALPAFCVVFLACIIVPLSQAERLDVERRIALNEVARLQDQSHGFDFLMGRWQVHNRRLVGRLQGSSEWQEFESTVECHPLPGGIGNQDFVRTEFWPGFVGMTFRFLNQATQKWSLYWVDNRNSKGVLDSGVFGSFSGDTGVFEGRDVLRGKPIVVRYTWSRITSQSPRWEQAFSPDGGKTWEKNWEMDFTRVDGPAR